MSSYQLISFLKNESKNQQQMESEQSPPSNQYHYPEENEYTDTRFQRNNIMRPSVGIQEDEMIQKFENISNQNLSFNHKNNYKPKQSVQSTETTTFRGTHYIPSMIKPVSIHKNYIERLKQMSKIQEAEFNYFCVQNHIQKSSKDLSTSDSRTHINSSQFLQGSIQQFGSTYIEQSTSTSTYFNDSPSKNVLANSPIKKLVDFPKVKVYPHYHLNEYKLSQSPNRNDGIDGDYLSNYTQFHEYQKVPGENFNYQEQNQSKSNSPIIQNNEEISPILSNHELQEFQSKRNSFNQNNDIKTHFEDKFQREETNQGLKNGSRQNDIVIGEIRDTHGNSGGEEKEISRKLIYDDQVKVQNSSAPLSDDTVMISRVIEISEPQKKLKELPNHNPPSKQLSTIESEIISPPSTPTKSDLSDGREAFIVNSEDVEYEIPNLNPILDSNQPIEDNRKLLSQEIKPEVQLEGQIIKPKQEENDKCYDDIKFDKIDEVNIKQSEQQQEEQSVPFNQILSSINQSEKSGSDNSQVTLPKELVDYIKELQQFKKQIKDKSIRRNQKRKQQEQKIKQLKQKLKKNRILDNKSEKSTSSQQAQSNSNENLEESLQKALEKLSKGEIIEEEIKEKVLNLDEGPQSSDSCFDSNLSHINKIESQFFSNQNKSCDLDIFSKRIASEKAEQTSTKNFAQEDQEMIKFLSNEKEEKVLNSHESEIPIQEKIQVVLVLNEPLNQIKIPTEVMEDQQLLQDDEQLIGLQISTIQSEDYVLPCTLSSKEMSPQVSLKNQLKNQLMIELKDQQESGIQKSFLSLNSRSQPFLIDRNHRKQGIRHMKGYQYSYSETRKRQQVHQKLLKEVDQLYPQSRLYKLKCSKCHLIDCSCKQEKERNHLISPMRKDGKSLNSTVCASATPVTKETLKSDCLNDKMKIGLYSRRPSCHEAYHSCLHGGQGICGIGETESIFLTEKAKHNEFHNVPWNISSRNPTVKKEKGRINKYPLRRLPEKQ